MEGKIKAQRANIDKFLNFCEHVCRAPEIKTSKGYLEGKGKVIDGLWARINSLNEEIVEGVTSELKVTVGPDFELTHRLMEQEYIRAFEMFDKVTILICTAMQNLSKEVVTKVQPLQLLENLVLQTNNQSRIKLKAIDIPVFGGDYTKWISFKNMFDSLVVNNKEFNNLQRMHYLGSCLSGDAERLISQFDITEDAFEPAYEAVKDRYNNEVILIDSHVIRILAQPDLKSESSQGLNLMEEAHLQEFQDLNCVVCRRIESSAKDRLIECTDCQSLYHQECHNPQISESDANENDSTWCCSNCKNKVKSFSVASPAKSSCSTSSSSSSSYHNKHVSSKSYEPSVTTVPSKSSSKSGSSKYKSSSSKHSSKSSHSSNHQSIVSSSNGSAGSSGLTKTPVTINIISADKRLQNMKKKAAKMHETRRKHK